MAIEDLIAAADDELQRKRIDPSKFPIVSLMNSARPNPPNPTQAQPAAGQVPVINLTQGAPGTGPMQPGQPGQTDPKTGLPVVSLTDQGERKAAETGASAPGSDAGKAIWATGFHDSAEKPAAAGSPYAGASAQPSAPAVVDLTKPAAPAVSGPPAATSAMPTIDLTGGAGKMQPSEPREPLRSDFPVKNMPVWKQILGGTLSAIAGIKDPNVGGATARALFGAPQQKADQAFERADADWKQGQQQGTVDLTRRNLESEINERDAQTTRLQKENAEPAKPELDDITKEFSDALAKGDQARIDALAPRVQQYLSTTRAPEKKPEGETPLGAQTGQLNKALETRYQVLNPGKPLPPEFSLPPNATQKDYDRIDKSLESVERAQGTKAQQEATREMQRQAAAAGIERAKQYGRNRPVNVIDTWNQNRPVVVSAGEAEENPGRYVTQAGGAKALSQGVTLDDIEGALNNLKATTAVLDKGTLHRAGIAAVLADPKTTASNFLQSTVAGQLSTEEQDYVIALLTAREVVPGIRQILGTGQATDSRVKNMLDTLPGAKTPSSAYANKQIDSALGTLKRVRPAVPNVKPQGNSGSQGTLIRPKPNVVVEQ